MATQTIHVVRERPVDLTLIESMEATIDEMDRLAEKAPMQSDREDVMRDAALPASLRGRGFSTGRNWSTLPPTTTQTLTHSRNYRTRT